MDLSKYKWIFFDIGGVIIDERKTTELKQKGIVSVLQKYMPGLAVSDVKNVWNEASSMIGPLHENVIKVLLKDKSIFDEVLKNFEIVKKDWPSHEKRNRIFPEAKEVISQLSKKYKLGVIANQPLWMREFLQKAEISQYFYHLGISEEYGFKKPDPRLFISVLKDAGSDPKESVFIDDNIERGLMPAKKLGMATIWLNDGSRKKYPPNSFDYEIKSLKELL